MYMLRAHRFSSIYGKEELELHRPVGVRAVAKHQKRRMTRSRRALHVMNVHVMQTRISLAYVAKMLIMTDA